MCATIGDYRPTNTAPGCGATGGRRWFKEKSLESHPNTEHFELVGNAKLAFRSVVRKVPGLYFLRPSCPSRGSPPAGNDRQLIYFATVDC